MQSRTPDKHRIIRTTIRRHARNGTHRLIADYATRVGEAAAGRYGCVMLFGVLSAHLIPRFILSFGLYPSLLLSLPVLRPVNSSRDTDARAVCRPNPFPLDPSPHCGATSARRVAPAVAHISAPFRLAPNPPRLGAGAPNVRRGAAQSSCRSARPEVGADAHSSSRRAGYGAFSPRRPISTLVLFPRVFLALHVCLVGFDI